MRVALFFNLKDSKWFSLSMERYSLELKKNLEKLPEENLELISFQPEVPPILTRLPAKWRYQLSRFYFYPFYAQRHEGQVNHITDHSFAQVSRFLNKQKTVITCHDLIPLKKQAGGERIESDPFALATFRESVSYLKDVKVVIADSMATKEDLMTLLNIPEERIRVIYLGRNEAFKTGVETRELREKLNLTAKPIILHVGHNLPYKNITGLLKALQRLKDEGVEFNFVKVGPEFGDDQKQLIEEYGLKDRVVYSGFLAEKELISMYNLASVLAYPSLFEGFGLPVLEALSCGLPVVISKKTSLEEIAGEAGILVDPNSGEDIAAGIKKALNIDGEELAAFKNAAVDQADKFNWEKTAQATLAVYKEVYEN